MRLRYGWSSSREQVQPNTHTPALAHAHTVLFTQDIAHIMSASDYTRITDISRGFVNNKAESQEAALEDGRTTAVETFDKLKTHTPRPSYSLQPDNKLRRYNLA